MKMAILIMMQYQHGEGNKMNQEIRNRLFQISHLRKDNFVTPVILQYYMLRQYFTAEVILEGMEKHYKEE